MSSIRILDGTNYNEATLTGNLKYNADVVVCNYPLNPDDLGAVTTVTGSLFITTSGSFEPLLQGQQLGANLYNTYIVLDTGETLQIKYLINNQNAVLMYPAYSAVSGTGYQVLFNGQPTVIATKLGDSAGSPQILGLNTKNGFASVSLNAGVYADVGSDVVSFDFSSLPTAIVQIMYEQ